MCDALTFLLDSILVRFGPRLCGRAFVIPLGTDCAPLVADLFLFCCEMDFVVSLSDGGQAGVVDAFDAASRCFGGVLGISGVYFGSVVGQVCPSELQLGGAGASDAGAAFFDLYLLISNDIVSARICGGRGDFGFEIVNFPILRW